MKSHFFLILLLTVLVSSSFVMQNSIADKASGKPIWEVGSKKVCGDRLCSEIEKEIEDEEKNSQKLTDRPRIQVKNGILPKDVICKDDLLLIKKGIPGSDSVACVTFETSLKLIERGWNPHHNTIEKILPHLEEIKPFYDTEIVEGFIFR